jgi:pimeloyl-ACP methyl ester carboxylesterase
MALPLSGPPVAPPQLPTPIDAESSGVFARLWTKVRGDAPGLDRLTVPGLPHARALDGFGRVGWHETAGGSGPPIVLVHPIDAAAGAHDVRPLFERLASSGRRVLALDLPGFGLSERTEAPYDAAFFALAIARFLRDVAVEPAHLVGIDLSAELCVRAAVREPSRVHALTLVAPTGLDERPRAPRAHAVARHARLRRPWIGRPLHALLTRTLVVESHVASLLGREPPEDLVEDRRRTARVAGAHHAPLAWIAGLLHAEAPWRAYAELSQPTTIVHDGTAERRYARLAELARLRPNVRRVRVGRCHALSAHAHPAALASLVLMES